MEWVARIFVLDFDPKEVIMRLHVASPEDRRDVTRLLDIFFTAVFFVSLPIATSMDNPDPDMQALWKFLVFIHGGNWQGTLLSYPNEHCITWDFKKKFYLMYVDPQHSNDELIGPFTELQRHQMDLWRALKYSKVYETHQVWGVIQRIDDHQYALVETFACFLGSDFGLFLIGHLKLNTILALTERILSLARISGFVEKDTIVLLVAYYDSIDKDILGDKKRMENDERFARLRALIELSDREQS